MRSQYTNFIITLAILGFLPEAAMTAQGRLGSEFQVNSYTIGSQNESAIAMDDQGDFVAVWDSNGSAGSDQGSASVQARRYSSSGNAIGADFQVNTYTPGSQTDAVVAKAPTGSFVVVWESQGSLNGDSSGSSIQAQRYDSSGNTLNAQFRVNSYTTGNQDKPTIAMDSDGDFVIVWGSYGSFGGDNWDGSIQGQRYDFGGATSGPQFQVNLYTASYQRDADVAIDPDGGFVIVWESEGSFDGDNLGSSIQGQRYASGGNTVGSQFQINSYTQSTQYQPSVAVGPEGAFVIAWSSYGPNGGGLDFSIQSQRFDSGGSAVGPQFQVSNYTTTIQGLPEVVVAPDGEFLVAWGDYGYLDSSPASFSVQGRFFSSGGDAMGTQLQVNSYTSNDQHTPAVAVGPEGTFVALWTSLGSSGTDSSARSIQGQLLRGDFLFADGFESGNTSAWSAVAP